MNAITIYTCKPLRIGVSKRRNEERRENEKIAKTRENEGRNEKKKMKEGMEKRHISFNNRF